MISGGYGCHHGCVYVSRSAKSGVPWKGVSTLPAGAPTVLGLRFSEVVVSRRLPVTVRRLCSHFDRMS